MDNDSKMSDDELKDLIKDALKMEIESRAKKGKDVKTREALASVASEFMTSFLILGYDLNGKEVVIRMEKNNMERNALQSLILKYVQCMIYDN